MNASDWIGVAVAVVLCGAIAVGIEAWVKSITGLSRSEARRTLYHQRQDIERRRRAALTEQDGSDQ